MLTNDAQRVRPALLEAFEREFTEETARRLLEFAARRVAMLQIAGVTVAAEEAHRLVREAISDALSERTLWRAGVIPVGQHLRDVVRRRTWAQLARQRRARWAVPATPPVATGERDAAPDAAARARDGAPRWDAAARLHQVLGTLSDRSEEDAAVRLLVQAYCEGAVTRHEVMASTGLGADDFAMARRKLDRLLAALPVLAVTPPSCALWGLP
jgi:hypothetical protein